MAVIQESLECKQKKGLEKVLLSVKGRKHSLTTGEEWGEGTPDELS